MRLNVIPRLLAVLVAAVPLSQAANYGPSSQKPPMVPREFRGLWIATVANIDWPSAPGLSTAAQKGELISILDRAAQMKLNAVVFQVRPACDALYASTIEPWSEYLTGTMGKAPEPFYDPLAFAIREAHERGLELHAWFNPYRALHKSHEGKVSPKHISQTRPELVKRFGQYLWLDPGEREVQDYSLAVVMEVVKRYDVDGIHFDDYFYPDPAESTAPFPDEPSWRKSGAGGGLNREDWRRENVNTFIQRVYQSIKAAKPWVKFGVSPHGIWRPGFPASIRGFDAYAKISADSRKWLASGWVDYFSPQLYWTIDAKEQSFPLLLDWWEQQNPKGRHVWPGISAAFALQRKWSPEEIANQIRITRRHPGASGYLFYNTSSLFTNGPLVDVLRREIQTQKALVPACPWLGSTAPPRPSASVNGTGDKTRLTWNAGGTNAVAWWMIQTKILADWQTEILPPGAGSRVWDTNPEAIALTAIDRFGNASAPCVLEPRHELPQPAPPARRRILQSGKGK